MKSALEEFVAEIGRNVFLREFSFAANTFTGPNETEVELADHVIAFPDSLVAFQVKERRAGSGHDPAATRKWFQKKVLQKGSKQFADTARYLSSGEAVVVQNQRGHPVDLSARADDVEQVLLYACREHTATAEMRTCRHRTSSRAGFIHVLEIGDYLQVCRCLAAPAEVREYLRFRREILSARSELAGPREDMIVAMFITESASPIPESDARRILRDAVADVSSFELGSFLRAFGDRVVGHRPESDQMYPQILEEFMRLSRLDFRHFRGLFEWVVEEARRDAPDRPCRMLASSGTGFVVIPVPRAHAAARLRALENLTGLMKHDWKLSRCLGMSAAWDEPHVNLDWCLNTGDWIPNDQLDDVLREHSPFRPDPPPKFGFRYPSLPDAEDAG